MSKALRKQGAEVLSEKKYPLPVNGLHSGLKTGHGGSFFMETICVSPASFPGLYSMGNPGSGAQRRRTGRVPCCKGLKKTRARACWKKKLPCDRLPVDHGGVYRIFLRYTGKKSAQWFF